VEPGACCVAAPIFDSSAQVTASISVSGPTTRMNRGRISDIAIDLKAAADQISAELGYGKFSGEETTRKRFGH
jgi:IclR family acetate operon transcriptional repressor